MAETIVLTLIHIAIWVNVYLCVVWDETIKKAKLGKPVKLMFDAWMFLSGVLFLVSVVVIAGNAFHFLERW